MQRFANMPVRAGGTLHWDVLALYQGILDGLHAAGRHAGRLDSIGIDSWAVDHGLLDAAGRLLGNLAHYRFNTAYQLVAAAADSQAGIARDLLLIPDLLAYWLTGERGAEITNASATQLLDVGTRRWATGLMERLGIAPTLFPPLREPGTRIGRLQSSVQDATGLGDDAPMTAVGSHDTASAVVAVPADARDFAYISYGTWSLVGLELDRPVRTDDSRRTDFTNELGVDGTVRYLRTVMGLWLLQVDADVGTRRASAGSCGAARRGRAAACAAGGHRPRRPWARRPAARGARRAAALRAEGRGRRMEHRGGACAGSIDPSNPSRMH